MIGSARAQVAMAFGLVMAGACAGVDAHEIYYVNAADGDRLAYTGQFAVRHHETISVPPLVWVTVWMPFMLDCGDGNDPILNLSLGGVCFGDNAHGNFHPGPGHLVGTSTEVIPGVIMNSSSLFILDDEFGSNVEGTYCQDWSGGGICGAEDLGEKGLEFRTEPVVDFCGFITIYGPPDDPWSSGHPGWNSGTTSDGWGYLGDGATIRPRGNWDETLPVFVFFRDAASGNPVTGSPGPCPNSSWRPGTKGFVDHI